MFSHCSIEYLNISGLDFSDLGEDVSGIFDSAHIGSLVALGTKFPQGYGLEDGLLDDVRHIDRLVTDEGFSGPYESSDSIY
jgi:hypothetical protein